MILSKTQANAQLARAARSAVARSTASDAQTPLKQYMSTYTEPRDTSTRRARFQGNAEQPQRRVMLAGSESSSSASPLVHHSRSFRTTTSSAAAEKTTSAAERAQIRASSWSRPPKLSQDAHDDVVPAYYIERRRQLDEIAERKESEGGLMAQLSAGILSEGIAAQMRVRAAKIPVEVLEEDGVVRHPSGFEPPTPETQFHPAAAKPNILVDNPLLTTVKIPWDEALDPSGSSAVTHMASQASFGSSK